MNIITNLNRRLTRPIQIVDGISYFATSIPVIDKKGKVSDTWVAVSGDFKQKYASIDLPDHRAISSAPFIFGISGTARPGSMLSSEAYQRYVLEQQPLPQMSEIFLNAAKAIGSFVSFDGSFARQEDMEEFLACWVISTYATDAFDTVGYVWPNGERGSGKTQCLKAIMSLSFMGQTVTSGSSFASMRDDAAMGATIGLDDCEEVRRMDPIKRELLLAGNTKGTTFMVKEPGVREGQWSTRHVDGFAPRAFTSIRLPDEVLTSRTILIPLVRSGDLSKTRRKPTNPRDWAIQPQLLRDSIWLTVARDLVAIEDLKSEVDSSSEVSGRDYDIFQAPLVIARWLETSHKVSGLFDRMISVMGAYNAAKHQNQLPSFELVVLQSLLDILQNDKANHKSLRTADITFQIQSVCNDRDITDEELRSADVQKVGMLLGRLGFKKSKSHGSQRRWNVSKAEVLAMAKSAGLSLDTPDAETASVKQAAEVVEYEPDPEFWRRVVAGNSKKLPW